MEMPQAKSSLQRRLEESRRDPREEYYSSVSRITGGTPSARSPRPKRELFPVDDAAPAEPRGASLGGFAENVLNDAFGIVKGLYQLIPTAGKAAYEILSDPKGMQLLMDRPELLTGAIGDSAVALKDAIIEPYQKHGIGVLYHRPVSTLLDALTVVGVVAGGVGATGRMARAAGAAEAGERLIEAGAKLGRMPSELTRSIVDRGVLKATGGKWDLAKRREYLAIKAEEASQIPIKIALDYDNAGKKVALLSDDEAKLWHQWRTQGYSKLDAAAHPQVAEALESYRLLATQWHESLKSRGLLDDARAAGALEKKYAAEAFGTLDDASLAKARQAIASVDHKPVYGPAIFEQKTQSVGDLVDRFIDMSKTSKGGKTNFLEEYKGKEGAIADPRKYVPEAIKNFRHVEGRLRFDESIIQTFGHPGIIKGEPLPMGVKRKHFDDTMRERAFDSIQDPTIKRLLKLERNVAGDPVRAVLGVYDRILNLWRRSATSWNPAYYTGNVVGDAVLGTLAGSEWLKAQKLIQSGAMPPQGMAKVGMAPAGGYIERFKDVANAADQAARAGIITRQVAKSISENALQFEKAGYTLDSILRSTQQLSDTRVQLQLLQENVARTNRRVQQLDRLIETGVNRQAKLAGPAQDAVRQRVVNLTKLRDDMVRDLADSAMKEAGMEARIPGLKAQNDVVRQAVANANDYIGDYLGLDGFEQGVMRRIIPFYPFAKAMNMLAFKLPFINPVKTFLWHRYSMAMWSMVGDPELPEWVQGYVPVFTRENGDMVWMRLSRYSPFEGLRQTKFADVPIPGIMDPGQNPFIGLGFKYMGGKTIFDRSPIPYGEPMVNISNGDVYEFLENGKLKKVFPQTPAIAGVAHFFPVAQYIEDGITPYVVNKYNWVGYPEPKLNADGSYRYPRELWERALSLAGVKATSRSPEDMIQAERSRVRQTIMSVRSAYQRSTDPDERKFLEQSLQDYARGEYRKIAR